MVEELVNGQVFFLLPLHASEAAQGLHRNASLQPALVPALRQLPWPFSQVVEQASHPGLMQFGLRPLAPVLQQVRRSVSTILRPALHPCLLEDLLLCRGMWEAGCALQLLCACRLS